MLVILLQAIGFQVQAQRAMSPHLKQSLISPEDVNIHYEEQAEYYIQMYESYLAEFKTPTEKDAEDIREQIILRKQKGKKAKFWEKMLSHAEAAVEEEKATSEGRRREKRKEPLKEYIKLWSDYEIAKSKDLSDLASESTCYEIRGESGTYAPDEYKILKINANETLQWDEVKPAKVQTVTRQVLVEEASSIKKQVKKPNCESPNPDDCLEWKEVAVPAKYKSLTERVSLGECKDRGFIYQDAYDRCTNTITINSTKKHIKVIDIHTNMEIQVIDHKEVKCE